MLDPSQLRRQFGFLRSTQFFFYATHALFITFLPLFYQNKGMDPAQIGMIMAVNPLVSIFAQPLWGYASDKVGSIRKILIIVLCGTLMTSFGIYGADHFVLILLSMFVYSIFLTPIQPLLDSMTIQTVKQVNHSYGSVRLWGSLGFCFTAWWTGYVLSGFGLDNMGYLYVALFMLPTLLVFGLRDPAADPGRPPTSLLQASRLLRHRQFAWFMFLVFLTAVPHRLNDSLLGIHISELGGTENQVGQAWMYATLSEAVIFAVMGYVLKRYREMSVLFVTAIIYCIRWWLYAWIDDPAVIVALQFTHGLTFAVFFQTAIQHITYLVPDHLRATGQSLFTAVFIGISGITGSLLGGWLMNSFGGSTMYTVSGCFSLIGAAMFFGTIVYTGRKNSF